MSALFSNSAITGYNVFILAQVSGNSRLVQVPGSGLNFQIKPEGLNFSNNSSSFAPPNTNGPVGPGYYYLTNSALIGGKNNYIGISDSLILGGTDNSVLGDVNYQGGGYIFGGCKNTVSQSDTSYIQGGLCNCFRYVYYSNISNGLRNFMLNGNNSSIINGVDNKSFYNSFAFIGNGIQNSLSGAGKFDQADADYSVILNGYQNSGLRSSCVLIGNGSNNLIDFSDGSTILNGKNNFINRSTGSSILGGNFNSILSSPSSAIINSIIGSITGAPNATIIGGYKSNILRNHSGSMLLSDSQDRIKISSGPQTLTLDFASGIYIKNRTIIQNDSYIPSNYISFGVSGQIAFDNNYFYRHNGENWTRTAMSTW